MLTSRASGPGWLPPPATRCASFGEALEFTGRFYAAGGDLIDLARTVSGVEPDLAATWRAGEQRRYDANAQLVGERARAGALAPG
jgi:hypothetical protein